MSCFRARAVLPCALATALLAGSVGVADAAPPTTSPNSGATEHVLVLGKDGAMADIAAAVIAHGGTVTQQLAVINGVAANIPVSAETVLRALPNVVGVTPDAHGHLMSTDPNLGYDPQNDDGSLGLTEQVIGATQSWVGGYTGKGVDVALIDSGVSPVPGLDTGNVVYGPDLSFDSQSPNLTELDAFGHGTHMASIIAGRDQQQGSGAGYASDTSHFYGIAPDARVISVKVASADGSADVSQVIAAIDWVDQHAHSDGLNIRVLNLSYGTNSPQSYTVDPLAYAAEQAWKHGILVVAAAGNDGKTTKTLADPAYDPYLLAVGASDMNSTADPSDDFVAWFTNRGWKSRPVDLLAPGVHVLGLRDPGSVIDQQNPTAVVGGRFFRGSGTSQATAAVSGAAALLIQRYPDATPDQIKAQLLQTAMRIKGQSTQIGSGEINVGAAETTPLTPLSLATQFPAVGTGLGSLDAARGGNDLSDPNGNLLSGELDIFGNPWTPRSWAPAVADQGSWGADGSWNGSIWTGTGFALQPQPGTDGSSSDPASSLLTPVWQSTSWRSAGWSGYGWQSTSWRSTSWRSTSWRDTNWDSTSWRSTSWRDGDWAGVSWS